MLKKSILLCLTLIALVACGQTKKENKEMKTLVTYFSASGVTANVANQIAEILNADIKEIKPENIYTEADLNWRDSLSRSSVEMKDLSSRPAIVKDIENFDQYDVVFVGFPIWWYTAPTIINTFIESYNFEGKKVVPFATSGGSSITKACNDLKASYPEIDWQDGKLLNGATKETITTWLEEL